VARSDAQKASAALQAFTTVLNWLWHRRSLEDDHWINKDIAEETAPERVNMRNIMKSRRDNFIGIAIKSELASQYSVHTGP
jgi:hypothetical protein